MARNWIFVINFKLDDDNFEEDDFEALQPEVDWPHVRYYCYEEEIGEEGTHHLQGYVQFTQPKRMTQLKKMKGLERAHLEQSRGTPVEAREYTLKLGEKHAADTTALRGTEVEWGTFNPGQGARTDIYKLRDMVKQGKSMREIYDNDETLLPALQYSRGLHNMVSTYNANKRRDFKTLVEVYVGPPGCGKTRRAAQENPNLYMKPHSKWWDQYQFEEVVLFDDFYGWYPYHQLLILLDRYECPVEVKGGYMQIAPKKIVITSNKHIQEWYDREKVSDISALLRRVDKYVWFSPNGEKTYEGSDMDEGLPVWYRAFQNDWFPRNRG